MNERYVLARVRAGGKRSPMRVGEAADPNELMDAACLRMHCLRVLAEQFARVSNDAPRERDLADVCMVLDLLAADAEALYEAAFLGASQHQGGKR